MKIAITGHTAGIGKAFSEKLTAKGHKIVGISRRGGENIRRIPHTASIIEPCDLFINNAQIGYAQTELLYEIWKRWKDQRKYIWNISTMMTEWPTNSDIPGQEDVIMNQYRNQKLSLEEASRQLRFKSSWPKISVIKPGNVATESQIDNSNRADAELWVQSVLDTFCHNQNIHISEISIGYTQNRIPL